MSAKLVCTADAEWDRGQYEGGPSGPGSHMPCQLLSRRLVSVPVCKARQERTVLLEDSTRNEDDRPVLVQTALVSLLMLVGYSGVRRLTHSRLTTRCSVPCRGRATNAPARSWHRAITAASKRCCPLRRPQDSWASTHRAAA
jgi:hypothetical protein